MNQSSYACNPGRSQSTSLTAHQQKQPAFHLKWSCLLLNAVRFLLSAFLAKSDLVRIHQPSSPVALAPSSSTSPELLLARGFAGLPIVYQRHEFTVTQSDLPLVLQRQQFNAVEEMMVRAAFLPPVLTSLTSVPPTAGLLVADGVHLPQRGRRILAQQLAGLLERALN